MKFVELLSLEAKKIIPHEFHALIFLDMPDEIYKPHKTSRNFIPDLRYCSNDLLLIGEAKTASDVDREHSKSQYVSYYEEALNFDGKAILLFSVPWQTKNTIKNMIRRIMKEFDKQIEVYVITEFGKEQVL